MPFESIFSGESFSTPSVANEWFLASMRFPMSFQVVLAVKR